MKQITLLMALVFISFTSPAQSTEEWLSQKKTQTKYLIQQIAALQVYLDYANKGHSIAQKGLKTINNIKNGEWNLHTDFINGKSTVNPTISHYATIADIIALQVKITQAYKSTHQLVKKSNLFLGGEVDYLNQVFATLLQSCAAEINDLTMVITPGKWKMNDDERLHRINLLHTSMLDKYVFVQDFTKNVQILAGSE